MSPDDAIVGLILDEKYLVESRLGGGGMGAVYFATHVGTSRPVAIKVIAPDLMRDEVIVEQFRREARAAGRLRHPNVVNVTDFGFTTVQGERVAYLVMEHLQGQTLAQLLETQPALPLARVVDILRQTCAGVEEAHRNGIIHRDLKPQNIWLEPRGQGGYVVKVLDFGVAKLREGPEAGPEPFDPSVEPTVRLVDPDATTLASPGTTSPGGRTLAAIAQAEGSPSLVQKGISGPGTLIGTPLYMSPEQWLNCRVDARSDVYSIGVIAYQMLAGEVPFTGRASSISMQHLREPPPPLGERAGIPPAVASVVHAALEKAPAARPPSALHFATVLAAGGEGTGAIVSRAIALCATHFTCLFGVTVMVLGPAIVACALRLTNRILCHAGVVPERPAALIGALCLGVYGLSVWLLQPFVAGLMAPRVRDALFAPHDPPRPRPTFSEIAACARKAFVPTLIILTSFMVISAATRQPLLLLAQHAGLFPEGATDLTPFEMGMFMLLEIPAMIAFSIVMGRWVAFPAVTTLEGIGGLRALGRSAALTRPLRGAAMTALGLRMLLPYVTVWLCWLSLAQIAHVSFLTMIDLSTDSILGDLALLFILLIDCVGWTFTFTAMALVYLNARQREGVTLEAMGEPVAVPEPIRPEPASAPESHVRARSPAGSTPDAREAAAGAAQPAPPARGPDRD
jgi:serine/threonine protein kinase